MAVLIGGSTNYKEVELIYENENHRSLAESPFEDIYNCYHPAIAYAKEVLITCCIQEITITLPPYARNFLKCYNFEGSWVLFHVKEIPEMEKGDLITVEMQVTRINHN